MNGLPTVNSGTSRMSEGSRRGACARSQRPLSALSRFIFASRSSASTTFSLATASWLPTGLYLHWRAVLLRPSAHGGSATRVRACPWRVARDEHGVLATRSNWKAGAVVVATRGGTDVDRLLQLSGNAVTNLSKFDGTCFVRLHDEHECAQNGFLRRFSRIGVCNPRPLITEGCLQGISRNEEFRLTSQERERVNVQPRGVSSKLLTHVHKFTLSLVDTWNRSATMPTEGLGLS